jgi:hypothetical protein
VTKRIVIDADVLRAASSSEHEGARGKTCRDALGTVLRICHRAVVTDELREEYEAHWSRFGRKWYVEMKSRNKLFATPGSQRRQIDRAIERAGYGAAQEHAVQEDLHLVLAALEADKLVLSGDDTARALFARLAPVGHVGWASVNDRGALRWLERGAPRDEVRLRPR